MHWQRASVKSALLFALLALLAFTGRAQTSPWGAQRTNSEHGSSAPGASSSKLVVTVTDENGVAIGSARIQLQAQLQEKAQAPPPAALPLRCGTDFAGRCEFTNLSPGPYELRVQKIGYYALLQSGVQVGATANIDVTLSRQQEAKEVVNVVESPPAIDPAQVSAKDEITGTEILDIPYPGANDYRNALFFIPGVTPGAFGEPHVAGAESYQTLLLLDGFNVTQPTNGQLVVQSGIDSFRSIAVTPSREPAEFGKGSGGVLGLNTRMGNDRFHFIATDFFPSPQTVKGFSVGSWTPIYTMSGPVRKGKMWFIDALDGEYDDDIVKQLPSGGDSDHVWRVDNLAKLQSNLTTRNIVTLSLLSDYYHDPNSGLSVLQPQPSTSTDAETVYLGSLKDQYYFRGGALLESGFGVDQYSVAFTPHGDSPYIEMTQGATGNYYERQNTLARRVQALSNLYLPPHQWLGRHDLQAGFDLDRLNYNAEFTRRPISFLQPDEPMPGRSPQPCPSDGNGLPVVPSANCARYSTFSGGTYSTVYNAEASAYVEDRWLVTNHLLLEPGLRFDWDEIVRRPLLSPRLAGTYTLDDEANTKLSAGIGITYDNTSLGLIDQPFEGQRIDYFFSPSGCPQDANGATNACTPAPPPPEPAPIPVPTNFVVKRNALDAPRYVNWSLGLEQKLPYTVFLKLEFLQKRGTHGFAYNTRNGAVDGTFLLGNARDDHYDAFTVSLRHRFRQQYEIFGAYTRSSSHTNQVFDFSLDFPVLTPQRPGPFAWDTPNRFIGYGILPFYSLPVIHKFDVVYSYEARSGQPFFGTTDQGEISSTYSEPFRLPTYYSINLQFEKRFHFFRRYWALRGGLDNVTNHANASVANSIIDSAHPFPTYIDNNGRTFDSRIRYLGKQ
jgi:hypothetical protein